MIDNAKLAADMEAVKDFLAYQQEDRKDPRRAIYVCVAVQLAFQHKAIGLTNANILSQEVRNRIENRSTLANFLKEQEMLPATTQIPGGYNLLDPAYLLIRDQFVDGIIKHYKEQ